MKEKLRGKSQWIIMGILEVLIGILLLVNPVYFTAGIVIAAGILLILGGLMNGWRYFKASPAVAEREKTLVLCLMGLALGVLCVAGTKQVIAAFPHGPLRRRHPDRRLLQGAADCGRHPQRAQGLGLAGAQRGAVHRTGRRHPLPALLHHGGHLALHRHHADRGGGGGRADRTHRRQARGITRRKETACRASIGELSIIRASSSPFS